jgi:hypothetical protein
MVKSAFSTFAGAADFVSVFAAFVFAAELAVSGALLVVAAVLPVWDGISDLHANPIQIKANIKAKESTFKDRTIFPPPVVCFQN